MASRHALLIGALWLAAVTAATSVGVVAVRLVGDQVGDEVSAPLSSNGVRQALSSVSPTPEPSEEPSEEPSDDPSGEPAEEQREGRVRTVTTDGGVVSGRCLGTTPTLLYATPADGYRTERTSAQGATLVRFVGRTRQVTLTLTCREDDLRVDTRTDRIGTQPAPSATPRETHDPEPSERPEPSPTPEPRETDQPDAEPISTDAPDD
jgi:hypothetical protein